MEPIADKQAHSKVAASEAETQYSVGQPSSAQEVEPSRKGGGKLWLLGGIFAVVMLILICLGALPRLMKHDELITRTKDSAQEIRSVSAVAATAGAPITEFVLPGNTQAIQDASIFARVNGYLSKRYVNIGDRVRTGQLLADIDAPELDQQVLMAKSSVEQSKANVDNSRQALSKAKADELTAAANVQKGKTDLQFYTAQVGRYEGLAKQGAVSYEDRDSRVQQYNGGVSTLESLKQAQQSAEANVHSAQANVHVAMAGAGAESAHLRQLQATQAFKKVTAPFDGVVVKRLVDAGALISSGSSNEGNTTLFEVAKTDQLRVFVYLPEQYVPYIKVGEDAALIVQEYPTQKFVGTVTNIAGGLDATSKTLQVEIHVPNLEGKLMPGMYVQVSFQVPTTIRLPIIPATTLQVRPDGGFVYIIGKDSKVHMRKITIGRDLGGQFEVAAGVHAGEVLVVNPPDDLHENDTVKPVMQEQMDSKKSKD